MSLNAQKTREFFPNVLRRIKLRTRLFVTFLIISLVPVIHERKGQTGCLTIYRTTQ